MGKVFTNIDLNNLIKYSNIDFEKLKQETNFNFNGIKKSNINKFYETNYILESDHFNGPDKKIVTLGDIHYHPHVDKEIYLLMLLYIYLVKPDYIVMPGDLVETIDFIDDKKEKEFFEYLIKFMAQICPVIIIPGNHELLNLQVKSIKSRIKEEHDKTIRYFESLSEKNIYFLNNAQENIDGINFIGFSQTGDTYGKKDGKTIDSILNQFDKCNFRISEDEYNILITHSNLFVSISDKYKEIYALRNLIDLMISGHWHDAYLPKVLDEILGNTNVGLYCSPFILPWKGIPCRGIHEFSRGVQLISQGFRKWTADIGLFNKIERFYTNDVEQIVLTKKR